MHRSKTFLGSAIVLLCLIALSACIKPTDPNLSTGVVSGTVTAGGRTFLEGVTVSIGDETTTTDANGTFFLTGLEPASSAKVDFFKVGFIPVQKVVKITKGQTTYISAALFQPAISTFPSSSSMSLTENGSQINTPADAFETEGGSPFTGTVQAMLHFYDSTIAENLDAFPGDFSGVQTDGTETMFESYGFVYAAFCDASDPENKLQLAPGKTAQITYSIPAALQANAPESIPIWYYDDTTGKWREQGTAEKTANYYHCEVSHFTYWNFDHPITITDQSTLTGRVLSSDTRSPVVGAQVVAYGVDYAGYTRAYSTDNGEFSISVKASANVTVRAMYGTSASLPSATIATPASGETLAIGDFTITDLSFTVMGRLLDTSGNPLTTGWGQLYQVNPPDGTMPLQFWITPDSEGWFQTEGVNLNNLNSFNVQFRLDMRSTLFSNQFSFTVPQPGQVWDFGEVTMRPGGNIKGRAKDNSGNWLDSLYVSFMKEGATGEGTNFSSSTDENGYFTLQGPPNTQLTNMRGSMWVENTSYYSPTMNLSFPASGSTSNIGTVIFTATTP
jgi:hypothetical protein